MSTALRAPAGLIAVLILATIGCSGDRPRTVPADTHSSLSSPASEVTTTPTTRASGVVAELLDPGPLSPRFGAATAAVEGLFLVYGGRTEHDEALDDGAVYDTTTGSWSLLPSSGGLAAGASTAFPSGGSVVLAGAFGVASLDLSTSRWTALPPPPSAQCCFFATTSSLLAIAGDATAESPLLSASRLDPTTRSWIELPPLHGVQVSGIVEINGSLIAVVGQAPEEFLGGVSDPAGMVAVRLEGDAWVDLGMPPLDWFYGIFATTDGTQMFVWDASFVNEGDDRTGDHGLAFSAGGSTWTEIAPLPIDWWECYISPVAFDEVMVVDVCGVVAHYDIAADEMTTINEPSTGPTPAPFVTIGAAAYRWGDVFCYGCDGSGELVFQRLQPAP